MRGNDDLRFHGQYDRGSRFWIPACAGMTTSDLRTDEATKIVWIPACRGNDDFSGIGILPVIQSLDSRVRENDDSGPLGSSTIPPRLDSRVRENDAVTPDLIRGPDEVEVSKQFHVYILASQRNGTLYTGVTSNLIQRTWQHKQKLVEGFTMKYGVNRLVYFEVHDTAESAIAREKQIKKWRRAWKLDLIEQRNPDWKDLYEVITL